jgi:hypothetical protein
LTEEVGEIGHELIDSLCRPDPPIESGGYTQCGFGGVVRQQALGLKGASPYQE